jgi:hypothetical protein
MVFTRKYIGFKIIVGDDGKLFMAQPDLIKKMKKVFGKYVDGHHKYVTPGSPGEIII